MSSPPPVKKRKSEGDGVAKTSWRVRSIERFGLQPVPDGWKDSVAVGSEDAWKRYYEYRLEKEEGDPRKSDDDRYDSDGNSISSDDGGCASEKEGMSDIVFSWEYRMEELQKCMAEGCKWSWTPDRPCLNWEEENRLRSADYYGYVWSPYAIPRAIVLSHTWNGRIRWESYDLATDWSYALVDFEESSDRMKHVEICSHNYDVIKTTHLNNATCARLRNYLYGSSDKSKKATCSDRDFWLLLFGSMGSTDKDLMEDAKGCSLGYSWCPWKEKAMTQKLFDAGAPANDDPNGEPPKAIKGYSPRWCSWLRYRILEVTDSLGPISKHYKPPTVKKGSGFNDSVGDSDSGLDSDYGY
ncbi:hypothetical protein ACHAWF_016368 [Thalassiosira exigua]